MKFSYIMIVILFSSMLLINSCGDDSSSAPEIKYITATEMSISGQLNSRQYNESEERYALTSWDLDSGKLVVLSSLNEEVGSGTVSKDGRFTLTLSAKVPETSVAWYKSTEGGVTAQPDSFRVNLVPFRIIFKKSNSESETPINYGVLNSTNSYPIESYGFFFADRIASINGTANSTGDIYSFTLKLGWNIRKEFKEDGIHKTYIAVESLPENMVWYH